MKKDRSLLLEGASRVEIDLAQSLLKEGGIPSVVEGPDFDVAELGRAAHDMIRGQNLYVPTSTLERARAVLDTAWGDGARELVGVSVGGREEGEGRRAPESSRGIPYLTLVLIALVILLGFLWMRASSDLVLAQRGDSLFEYSFEEPVATSTWRETGERASELHFYDANDVPDMAAWFDKQGVKSSAARDEDQDGIWEETAFYDRDGEHTATAYDRDGDGRTDRVVEHRKGGVEIHYTDEDRDGFYERREILDAEGRRVRIEEDRELEGWIEVQD